MDARGQLNVENGGNDAGMGQKLGYVNEHVTNANLAANNKLLSW